MRSAKSVENMAEIVYGQSYCRGPVREIESCQPKAKRKPNCADRCTPYSIRGLLMHIGARADQIIGRGLEKSVMRCTQYPSMA